MKKCVEAPEMEIIRFEVEDVLTTSGTGDGEFGGMGEGD